MKKQEFNKKYDDVMMETAYVWTKKSKCIKKKVAAVIAKDNVIISIGINGTPKGFKRYKLEKCDLCNGTGIIEIDKKESTCPNCGGTGKIKIEYEYDCEDKIKICPKCKKEYKNDEKINFCTECGEDLRGVEFVLKTDHDITLHAEQNALINAARLGHKVEGTTMYVSTAPCSRCALLIAQAGIVRVVYSEKYKNDAGIKMLESLGICVEQYKKD